MENWRFGICHKISINTILTIISNKFCHNRKVLSYCEVIASLMMPQLSMARSQESKIGLLSGWEGCHALSALSVTLSQSWVAMSSCRGQIVLSFECVTLPCDIAWAAGVACISLHHPIWGGIESWVGIGRGPNWGENGGNPPKKREIKASNTENLLGNND